MKPIEIGSLRDVTRKKIANPIPYRPLPTESVASILKHDFDATIQYWMGLVEDDQELSNEPSPGGVALLLPAGPQRPKWRIMKQGDHVKVMGRDGFYVFLKEVQGIATLRVGGAKSPEMHSPVLLRHERISRI